MSDFKKKYSLDERKNITIKILEKYEDKCPIYLSIDKQILSNIDSMFIKNINRYIVTSNLTLTQFLSILRKKINFSQNESLTLFVEIYNDKKIINSILAPLTSSIGSIYNNYKDEDGFIYLNIVKENVFG
jgi:GABA(A) receptor-associated protein